MVCLVFCLRVSIYFFVCSLCSACVSLAALGLCFTGCAGLVFYWLRWACVSLAALGRVGRGIHAFFRCHPWQYESLLKSAKLTKTLVWPVGRW